MRYICVVLNQIALRDLHVRPEKFLRFVSLTGAAESVTSNCSAFFGISDAVSHSRRARSAGLLRGDEIA